MATGVPSLPIEVVTLICNIAGPRESMTACKAVRAATLGDATGQLYLRPNGCTETMYATETLEHVSKWDAPHDTIRRAIHVHVSGTQGFWNGSALDDLVKVAAPLATSIIMHGYFTWMVEPAWGIQIDGAPRLTSLIAKEDVGLMAVEVRRCPALTTLECGRNDVCALEVGDCPALTVLKFDYQDIHTMDVICPALTELWSTTKPWPPGDS